MEFGILQVLEGVAQTPQGSLRELRGIGDQKKRNKKHGDSLATTTTTTKLALEILLLAHTPFLTLDLSIIF